MLVAAACILAVGVVSTSLDSVETDPSDVIDTSQIPTQDNPPTSGTETERGDEEDAGYDQVDGTAEDEIDAGTGDAESDVMGGGETVMTLWQRLLLLLQRYMWYIIGGVAGLVAIFAGYYLYKRYIAGRRGREPQIVYDADTSNDVYRSWWEMVEMVDADDPTTKTPQEFAEMAVDDGYDEDAVSELTEVFEETLYGGREVTKEQERRARDAVEKIKADGRKKSKNAERNGNSNRSKSTNMDKSRNRAV